MGTVKEKLGQYMNAWFKADRFSGTILVSEKDEVLLEESYGLANHQYKVKNTNVTKYKIGSCTKQFTAASILKLYEEGKLELEDKIIKYIPEYIHSAGITVHQLLSHTSGIPEHTGFEEYSTRERINPTIIIDRLNKRALNFVPGERVEYSNSNYVLLAKIVEDIAGVDIEFFYKKYLFAPAGLKNTGISRNEEIIPDLAQGYSCSGQGVINADYYDMSGAYGSGFLYSNAEDLLKWTKALLGGRIFSPDILVKMLSPYGYVWYMDAHAGYGCFVKGEPAGEICASGLVSGYVFNLWVDLKEDRVVILMSNNDTTALGRVLKGIKSLLSGEDASVEIRPRTRKFTRGQGLYANLAGRYRCEYTGGEFNISLKDDEVYVDRLWIQEYRGKKFKLDFIEETAEEIVFACEVCDGKFIFTKGTGGIIERVLYIYDIFTVPYVMAAI
jgi:CubicO group peptidase (beta-lactamase class C family)